MTEPRIALLFPPLVETNFGTYFPATAVLAAYLHNAGIETIQEDLNEEFAVDLLDGRFDADLAEFDDDVTQSSIALLRRHRNVFFSPTGQHRFRQNAHSVAQLLQIVVKNFRSDLPLRSIASVPQEEWPHEAVYARFFARAGSLRLPASVALAGISVAMGPQLIPALLLARHLKQHRPELRIVLGGPVLSLMGAEDRERLLRSEGCVDAVVRFDGELPLLQLSLQALHGEWRPDVVSHVSSLAGGGDVVEVPPAPGLQLDELPFAHYDERLLARLDDPEIGVIQARGCYWGRCDYCDFVELYEGSPAFRTRTAKRVVDEIEYQSERHGAKRFSIITEAIPPAFADRLSREMIERRVMAQWNSFAMVDRRFTSDLLARMRESGCEYLIVGLESMNDRVLGLVHKAATRQDNLSFLRNAYRAGLRINVNLIPDLPTTTLSEAEEDLRVLADAEEFLGGVAIFPFEASKSSAIGRDPEAFGFTVERNVLSDGQAQYATNHLEAVDQAMSATTRREVHARYRAFARRHNGHVAEAFPLTDETALRFASERVDVVERLGKTLCYDHERGLFFELPEELVGLVRWLQRANTFRVSRFLDRFDAQTGPVLLRTLVQHNLLTVATTADEPTGGA